MAREGTEKDLYDAASKGDLSTFQQLLQGDIFLLDSVSFAGSRNLLHIATICEQAAIVEEVLRIHPRLAQSPDSQNSTPLHIAAAQGNLEIIQKLLRVAPEMCWWRDSQSMNPVHVAAVNGHVEILEALIALDSSPAMEKVDGGHTVLHLCVMHRQLRVLEVLVGKLGNNLVSKKNVDGETLLHLSAGYNELEMIKYLVKNTKIKWQSMDSMGRTVLDILRVTSEDTNSNSYLEVCKLLRVRPYMIHRQPESFMKMGDGMIVAMVMIAGIAFQANINPPGGAWQDYSATHRAGEAVMASTHPDIYQKFVRANGRAFGFSITAIFFITTIQGIDIHPSIISSFFYIMALPSVMFIMSSYDLASQVLDPRDNPFSSFKYIITDHDLLVFLLLSCLWICIFYGRIPSFIGKLLRRTPPQTPTQTL